MIGYLPASDISKKKETNLIDLFYNYLHPFQIETFFGDAVSPIQSPR